MKYIFIDPSGSFSEGKGHTGIAIMEDDNWKTLTIESFAAKDYLTRAKYWNAIIRTVLWEHITLGVGNVTVIIESFQIRTHGFLMGKMPETIMFIGALTHALEEEGVHYVFQTPSQAKSRFKDEALPKYIPEFELRENGRYYFRGKQTNDHMRDALKHLLFYKKYHKKEK